MHLEAIGIPAAGVCAKQTAPPSQISRMEARLPESPPRSGLPRHTAPKKENSLAPKHETGRIAIPTAGGAF
jgi:hypothetical protein